MLGRADDLTRGRLLARNVLLNLAGWVLPALVALAALPALLRSMGAERFGLLSLAWTLVGYFSLFDLGIGRALTQALAERLGRDAQEDSPALTWTALWLLLLFGTACAVALAAAAPALATRVLTVPPALQAEATSAIRLLALAVPPMLLTSGLRGVLEAGQQFRSINALRVPLGVLTFAGPLAAQLVSHRLPLSVGVLVGARVLLFALHAVLVARLYPRLRLVHPPRGGDLRRLWRSAGWMTVSSVVSPVLVFADRFAVGALLPVAAVAHYTAASEVATKMWLFTAALIPVLFPAIAATRLREPERAAAIFDRGVRVTVLAVLPAALVLVCLAREGLSLWMGASFAREAAPVLQWLSVAVFANCIAQLPYAVLQGGGRADLAARLHLVELPIYLALVWALLSRFGLIGVALAWTLRMVVDGVAMLACMRRVLPEADRAVTRATRLMLGAAAVLVAAIPVAPLGVRLAIVALGLPAIAVVGWSRLLTVEERASVRLTMARLRGRPASAAGSAA